MAIPVANSVAFTGSPLIDGLTQGSSWQFAGPRTVTYSRSVNDAPPVSFWLAPFATAVDQALAEWSNVANITFLEVGSGTVFTASSADMAVTLTGDDLQLFFDAVGLGLFPDPGYALSVVNDVGYNQPGFPYPRPEGDVFFDNFYSDYSFLAPGGIGFADILHEFGHALGLKHPHDRGGNNRPTFSELGIAGSDSQQYTVMSYNDASSFTTFSQGNAATPMLLDILAIQYIYGANSNFRTGDDTYLLANDGIVHTVWDAGGIDTIDASGLGFGVTIDLRAAAIMPAGNSGAITAIAYNVLIENTVGSAFNDTIIGNYAPNNIDGGPGGDSMSGGDGNDAYIVDDSSDIVTENPGEGADTVLSSISYTISNTLPPNVENLTLTGTSDLSGAGNQLDNIIQGNAGANELSGGAGNDFIDGGSGVDTMIGGQGDDTYVVVDVTLPVPSTLLRARGDAGDNITGGRNYLYTPSDGAFNITLDDINQDSLVDVVSVFFLGNTPGNFFQLAFSTGRLGQNLVSGTTYTNAMRFPFEAQGHPGLDFALNGSGSNTLTGSFTVVNASFNYSGTSPALVSFSADFEQHSEGAAAASFGTFNFNFGGSSGGAPEPVIELPSFGNDTVLSSITYALPDDVENVALTGSAGINAIGNSMSNVLRGNSGANLLDGRGGNDTLRGGEGADTYLFALGSGQDWIQDVDTTSNSIDTLSLGTGILTSGVRVFRQSDDLLLRITGTQDQITFSNYYLSGYEIEHVQFADATLWDANALASRLNRMPVVTAGNATVRVNQAVLASTLFSVSDAESDAIAEYRLYDEGTAPNSGYFRLNGVRQAAEQTIVVAASQLANLQWVAGSQAGTERAWARASDGFGLGAWTNWTMSSDNGFPVVIPVNANRSVHAGQAVTASTLFNVTDADNDPIIEYRFYDEGTGANSGYFRLNGVRQPAEQTIVVSAAQLTNLQWVAGSEAGVEQVWARASDGIGLGAWVNWTMTSDNAAPVVTPASANRSLHSGQTAAASSLFGVSDADNDAIAEYRFYDEGLSQSSGYFSLNGVRQPAEQTIVVSAAQLANLQWVAGSQAGVEQAWARASDGFGLSAWVNWTMTSNNAAPVVTPASANRSLHSGQTAAASSLFSVSDADNDAIAEYRFYDEGTGGNSGYFSLNGVRQAAEQTIVVSAAQLANLQWVAGSQAGAERVWARATDGFALGAWVDWTMTSTNSLPVVTATDQVLAANQSVAASSLFSVSDADNDAIAEYRFYDEGAAQTSGYFSLTGVRQSAEQSLIIPAGQLASLQWVAGSQASTERVWARASDGFNLGAWTNWNMDTANSQSVIVSSSGSGLSMSAGSVSSGNLSLATTNFNPEPLLFIEPTAVVLVSPLAGSLTLGAGSTVTTSSSSGSFNNLVAISN